MTPERIRSVLQKIADGASRNDLHGHSIASLEKSGLVRCELVADPITKNISGVEVHLTPEGRIELDRLSVYHQRRKEAQQS